MTVKFINTLYVLEIIASSEKYEIKRQEMTPSLFADDMINSKETTKNLQKKNQIKKQKKISWKK